MDTQQHKPMRAHGRAAREGKTLCTPTRQRKCKTTTATTTQSTSWGVCNKREPTNNRTPSKQRAAQSRRRAHVQSRRTQDAMRKHADAQVQRTTPSQIQFLPFSNAKASSARCKDTRAPRPTAHRTKAPSKNPLRAARSSTSQKKGLLQRKEQTNQTRQLLLRQKTKNLICTENCTRKAHPTSHKKFRGATQGTPLEGKPKDENPPKSLASTRTEGASQAHLA